MNETDTLPEEETQTSDSDDVVDHLYCGHMSCFGASVSMCGKQPLIEVGRDWNGGTNGMCQRCLQVSFTSGYLACVYCGREHRWSE